MNWGTGIVISIVAFMSFILYLVYGTFQENIDLVAEDICELLQEFAYDFDEDQRDRIQDILSENQPI